MPHPQSLPRTLDTINSRGVHYVYDDVRAAYGCLNGKYKVQNTAKLLKKKHHFVADAGTPLLHRPNSVKVEGADNQLYIDNVRCEQPSLETNKTEWE